MLGVAHAAAERSWGVQGVAVSPLPGPSGNVEFFLWLRLGPATLDDEAVHSAVRAAAPAGAASERVDP